MDEFDVTEVMGIGSGYDPKWTLFSHNILYVTSIWSKWGKNRTREFPLRRSTWRWPGLDISALFVSPSKTTQYLQSQSKTKWLPSGFIKRGNWTSYQNEVVNTKMGKSSINSNMNGGQSKKWRFIAVIMMDVPRSAHCSQSGSWGWVRLGCCYISISKNEEHRWWWSPNDVPNGFTGWIPPKKHIM
jgi:hypothetical protein